MEQNQKMANSDNKKPKKENLFSTILKIAFFVIATEYWVTSVDSWKKI